MKNIFALTIVSAVWFALLSDHASAAGIKKWIDKDGKAHYGERPPSEVKADTVKGSISVVDAAASVSVAILYSTSACGYCKKARAFMNANGINFQERDIEKSSSAYREFKDMGGRGVPVLALSGKAVHGFSVEKYRKFFDL